MASSSHHPWAQAFSNSTSFVNQQKGDGSATFKLTNEGRAGAISNYHQTDSLTQYFDSSLKLVDSASSTHGRHLGVGLSDDPAEQMDPLEIATLNRLLPDLDGDGEQQHHQPQHYPQHQSSNRPAALPHAPLTRGAEASSSSIASAASMPSKPLRRRVGSTASVEEDIFSTVGGLELGHEFTSCNPDSNGVAASAASVAEQLAAVGSGAATASGSSSGSSNPSAGAATHGLGIPSVASLADLAPVETPSRTLFVQKVAADVSDEDVRRLFAAHGDLRTLYTASKHRGLVIIGYYDLRSAMSAAQALSGYVLAGRPLEVTYSAPKKGEVNQVNQGVVVVYNLDPDTTNEQLVWIFSRFGEVRDIQQAPQRANQKFIEFYDVRHAAAALRAMNKAELSRLPSGGVAAAAAAAAGGPSSSSSIGLLPAGLLTGQGGEHCSSRPGAVGSSRSGRLSNDGVTPRRSDTGSSAGLPTGLGGSSSSHQALAAAQVAAAMQQLELEQQQQHAQQPTRSQVQPIPRPGGSVFNPHAAFALQQAESMQQAAQRGMVRPVSGMLERLHSAVSPPLSLGPLSQSWDTSSNTENMMAALQRQQQQQGQANQQQQQQYQATNPLQQQQQQAQQQQLQQQQLLLQQALATGFFRGSRTDLSGLDPVVENAETQADTLQKLLLGAGTGNPAAAAVPPGPTTRPGPVGSSGMHVSDSASSIVSSQFGGSTAAPGVGILPSPAHHQGLHNHHQGFGQQGFGGFQQPLRPSAATAAAAAAAAAASNAAGMNRSFGSTDQLTAMEQLLNQSLPHSHGDDSSNAAGSGMLGAGSLNASLSSNNLAAAAAAAGLSGSGAPGLNVAGLAGAGGLTSGINSASFDSGLNLIADLQQQQQQPQQAAGLGGFLGSNPYLLGSGDNSSAAAGGLYKGAGLGQGGARSLSHPCLSMSAMAAAAAHAQQQQQQQNAAATAAAAVAAGRLLNQQNAAAAAAAMLQAQAAGLSLQELQQQQQQQQQQLALQQLLQANLHAQSLAGAANLHAVQQLLQAGMHPQQLAAAGLLSPAALAGLGLPTSSSYGSLHNLGALQLQSAAAAAAAANAAAAAAAGSGMSRGVSTGSLSGLTGGEGGRSHRGAAGVGTDVAAASGGSRGGGRLSRRAADPAVEAERKAQQEKLFALDLDQIVSGEDKRTTLMIKNIPNKYTQKMLLQTIEEQFKGTFDFFYLPIDFKNKCNVGYAFINMLSPQYIPPLVARFNNKRWDKFNSEKVCSISYGRIQGRAALISHFQNSSLMHEDKRCRPVLFISEGPDAGEPEPFPMSVHVRPRAAGNSSSGGQAAAGESKSPRVSSSGAISSSSGGPGDSLAGSRGNSSNALAAVAAAAAPTGGVASSHDLSTASSMPASVSTRSDSGGHHDAPGGPVSRDAAADGSEGSASAVGAHGGLHAPPGLGC